MSDDLNVLRRTMAELSEHGGSTDLYDRTLHTSRRLGRRRAAASGAAVAAAVLVIGVPVALADRRQPPSLPTATIPAPSPAPSPSSTSAAPVEPKATTPKAQVTHRETPRDRPSSKSSSAPPDTDGCPVKASALQRAADLPDGYRIDASSIRCSKGWALAGLIAPSPDMQGDGEYVFEYDPDAGRWKKKGEGSAIRCGEFGIPKNTGLCDDPGA